MGKRVIRSNAKRAAAEKRLIPVARRLRDLFGVPVRKRKLPDPLDLLIATILSQNTNDINSHKAFVNLKSVYPDFIELTDANPRSIEKLIKVGGIAKKKSKTIVSVATEVKKTFGRFDRKSLASIPPDQLVDKLTGLDGVGYKTASCVLLFALGDDDAFPVDTHVHRILNRIGIVHESTPDKTYVTVRDKIPSGMGYEIHINLIKFGRMICTAQRPRCYDCTLYDLCDWDEKVEAPPLKTGERNQLKVDFMTLEEV